MDLHDYHGKPYPFFEMNEEELIIMVAGNKLQDTLHPPEAKEYLRAKMRMLQMSDGTPTPGNAVPEHRRCIFDALTDKLGLARRSSMDFESSR